MDKCFILKTSVLASVGSVATDALRGMGEMLLVWCLWIGVGFTSAVSRERHYFSVSLVPYYVFL